MLCTRTDLSGTTVAMSLIADETIWSGEIDRRLLRSDAASCVNVEKSGGSGGKPRGGRVAVLNVALETLVTSRKLDN